MIIKRSDKVWWLIDCDSFYASCEVLRNPALRWKPVCVGRDKDIVLAATYEAKRYGIRTGTATWDAKKLYKDIIIIPPDFAYYGRISEKLVEYLYGISERVEVFSIDESFVDLSWLAEHTEEAYKEFWEKLKIDIKNKIWIPVSIWLWPTKSLAKMFCKINKPRGQFVALEERSIDNVLKSHKVGDITFIWSQWNKKLQYMCKTAYDFKALNYEDVKNLMWQNGMKLRFELNSINAMTFGNPDKPKGISRVWSFHPDFTTDKAKVYTYLLENFERAYTHLLDVHMKTKYIKVYTRDKDFNPYSMDVRLPYAINKRIRLSSIIKTLFEKVFISWLMYRTTWIFLWELENNQHKQPSIFDIQNVHENNELLSNTINKLNKRFWDGIITIGFIGKHVKKKMDDLIMGSVR